MTPAQCRAARGLLGWSQSELGERARVAQKTITKFESEARVPHPRTIEALVKVFEGEGVVFLEATETVVIAVGIRVGSAAAAKLQGGGAGGSDDDALKASGVEDAERGTLL